MQKFGCSRVKRDYSALVTEPAPNDKEPVASAGGRPFRICDIARYGCCDAVLIAQHDFHQNTGLKAGDPLESEYDFMMAMLHNSSKRSSVAAAVSDSSPQGSMATGGLKSHCTSQLI